MRRAWLVLSAPVVVLVAMLVLPAGVLAADPVAITGTVVRDGLPQAGVRVTITVTGGDTVAQVATDEAGVFALAVEAAVGSEVHVVATGQALRSEPDANGCTTTETPVGATAVTVDAIPPAPITVQLDQVRTTSACPATATPRITPPSTDALVLRRQGSASPGGLALVLGLLALTGAASLLVVRRRS